MFSFLPNVPKFIKGTLFAGTLLISSYQIEAQVLNIAVQPKDVVNCQNSENNSFFVVTGVTNPTSYDIVYEWYKDGKLFAPASKSQEKIIFPKLDYAMSGKYFVKMWSVVKNSPVTSAPTSVPINSNSIVLNVLTSPAINGTIPTQYAKVGQEVKIDATAHIYGFKDGINKDYSIKVQWYKGTTKLVDNEKFAGTKSSALSIRNVTSSDFGNDYWVELIGHCGTISSEKVAIMASPTITISSQPMSTITCKGSWANAKVKASASNSGKLSYNWYIGDNQLFDNDNVHGAHTDSLSWRVSATKTENVWCKISFMNDIATAWSDKISGTVIEAPSIKTDLEDASIQASKDYTLKIELNDATNANYKWFKDGSEIAGKTTNELVITNASATDAAKYKCEAINDCGKVSSKEATIAVTAAGIVDNEENSSNEEENNQEATTTGIEYNFDSYGLQGNYPNPFNNLTTISFNLEKASNVKLTISDIYGNKVAELINSSMNAGLHKIEVNAKELNLSNGVYYYTLESANSRNAKQMILVK